MIKDGIVGLADGAFAECHTAKQVVLPDSLLYIGKQAFKCCDNMASVCFPVALQSIGDEAFAGCVHLKRMDLPCASFLESISLGVNWNAVSADGNWGEPCLDDIDARQLSEESILSLKDAEIPSLLQLEKSLETWSHQRWRDVKCT